MLWYIKMTCLKPKHENNNVVTPLKKGVQLFYHYFKILDSGLRRNDGLQVA